MGDEPTITYKKDEWQWWKDNLAGKPVPMHDVPMQGFYAVKRSANAVPEPVAVWYKGGACMMKVGNDIKSVEWVWMARNPISHDVYKSVMAGEPWPAEIRITRADGTTDSSMSGHNSAGDDANVLDDLIEWTDRANKMKKKGTPETLDEANAVSDVATKLAELTGAANKKRLAETLPLRNEVDLINGRWNEKINPADMAVKDLKTLVGLYQRKENARRAEEARKLAEQAKEAGLEPEEVKVVATPVRTGTRGKSISMVKVAVVNYDDRAKAATYLLEQSHPDFITEMDRIILRLLRAGAAVPGAKLDHVDQAR